MKECDKLKNIFKYTLTFIITVIICIISFILVTIIPNNLIKENIKESANYIYKLPVFMYVGNYKNKTNLVNNHPDPITLNLTYSLNPKKPITSIVLTKYYSTGKYLESINLREKAIHDYEPNQEYYRYWHGNIVIVKLLLLIFNYKEILVFLSSILVVLIVLITYQLFKRDKLLAFIFLIGNILIKVYVTFFHLSYLYMFLLSYILTLISFKLINAKEDKIYKLFIIGGVLANFFDFLTTETLVFALPFLVIFYFRYKDKKVDKEAFIFFIKSLLAFLLSYSLMWILKWLILVVFYHQSLSSFLTNHLLERSINKYTYTLRPFDSILYNIKGIIPFCYLNDLFMIVVISLYLIYIVINFIKKRFKLFELILVLISIVPIIRYLVLFNHSYGHFYFTYRALLPSVMISLLLIFRNIKRKRGD